TTLLLSAPRDAPTYMLPNVNQLVSYTKFPPHTTVAERILPFSFAFLSFCSQPPLILLY
ncbi:unnamed protein product, partial [Rotaria magnacalcarata]